MQSVNLFKLASQQAQWVAVRQQSVASNIANMNSTGFAPTDVAPFKEILQKSSASLRITDPQHVSGGTGSSEFKVTPHERASENGNTPKVSVEKELIAAGDIRKSYEMNTAIVKSFHRMILMTTRGS